MFHLGCIQYKIPVHDRCKAVRNLLIVGGVDKVTTGLVERVQQLKASFFVNLSQTLVPSGTAVADAHGSKL
jgi:hypothetical protein